MRFTVAVSYGYARSALCLQFVVAFSCRALCGSACSCYYPVDYRMPSLDMIPRFVAFPTRLRYPSCLYYTRYTCRLGHARCWIRIAPFGYTPVYAHDPSSAAALRFAPAGHARTAPAPHPTVTVTDPSSFSSPRGYVGLHTVYGWLRFTHSSTTRVYTHAHTFYTVTVYGWVTRGWLRTRLRTLVTAHARAWLRVPGYGLLPHSLGWLPYGWFRFLTLWLVTVALAHVAVTLRLRVGYGYGCYAYTRFTVVTRELPLLDLRFAFSLVTYVERLDAHDLRVGHLLVTFADWFAYLPFVTITRFTLPQLRATVITPTFERCVYTFTV